MKLISEVEECASSGSVVIEERIGFLPHCFEHVCGDELAIVTLLNSLYDPEIDGFLTQLYEPFSSEWLEELSTLGGHKIFKQANRIGLAIDLLKKSFENLSGGDKTKQKSCYGTQYLKADIILLDEPTNCLDPHGIEWLENSLKNFDGGIITVTHGSSLIHDVSNRISEFSPHAKKFTHFRGGYKNCLEEEEKR
jgi:ATPase subunit of ABC transporter with duplicated ATPase domains